MIAWVLAARDCVRVLEKPGVTIPQFSLQDEYIRRHPAGVNPVQLNDVVFSIHAFLATAFTIFQCFILKVCARLINSSHRLGLL